MDDTERRKIMTACSQVRGLIDTSDIYGAGGFHKVLTVVQKWALAIDESDHVSASADLFEANMKANRIAEVIKKHLLAATSGDRPDVETDGDVIHACITSAMLHFIEMSHMVAMAVCAIVAQAIKIDEEESLH